jgi:ASC-1-like (ASCH) protein
MKKWVLRFREVDRSGYNDIVDGHKSVETRAATVKYKPIQAGDMLVITCGKERIEKPIKAVRYFSSIDELFANIELKKVMPQAKLFFLPRLRAENKGTRDFGV